MIRIFDFSAREEPPMIKMPEQVREGFDSVLIARIGDFPPSVLAAMWRDLEFENDACFREVLAQVYFDNCGEDIADDLQNMIDRLRETA